MLPLTPSRLENSLHRCRNGTARCGDEAVWTVVEAIGPRWTCVCRAVLHAPRIFCTRSPQQLVLGSSSASHRRWVGLADARVELAYTCWIYPNRAANVRTAPASSSRDACVAS